MGMFKGLKQMKEAVAGAPGLIDQAQQLQAAALQQQAAAQQQAAMAAGVPAGGIGQGITPAPGARLVEPGRRRADRWGQHRAVRRPEPRARRPRLQPRAGARAGGRAGHRRRGLARGGRGLEPAHGREPRGGARVQPALPGRVTVGFFKDINKLAKAGREVSDSMPPPAG